MVWYFTFINKYTLHTSISLIKNKNTLHTSVQNSQKIKKQIKNTRFYFYTFIYHSILRILYLFILQYILFFCYFFSLFFNCIHFYVFLYLFQSVPMIIFNLYLLSHHSNFTYILFIFHYSTPSSCIFHSCPITLLTHPLYSIHVL